MKTLLIAVLLLGSGAAGFASAADAPRVRDDCPKRGTHEDGGAYGLRARSYCEARWTSLLSARETGGQTHDEFLDRCLHQCVTAENATAGAPLDWILGGIWAGTLTYGLAAGGGGPGSPPASP